MRPNRLTAARTAASASVRLVTSSLTTSRSSDSPMALATASGSRPVATTAWPAARAALAKSTPMPRAAPVMNQIFLPVLSVMVPPRLPNLFHPLHDLAVEMFLNGEVRDRGAGRGAVPMLLTGRNPDHVTGPNLLDRPSPALRAPSAGRHDQGLAQRVRVPGHPGAGLKRDTGAGHA